MILLYQQIRYKKRYNQFLRSLLFNEIQEICLALK